MTNQEAFDGALFHLRKQKLPAKRGHLRLYRMEGGFMCGIGALIPDSIYSKDMEYNSVFDLLCIKKDQYPELVNHFKDVNIGLLSDIQEVHDYQLAEDGLAAWEVEMARIAVVFGLNYTLPQ